LHSQRGNDEHKSAQLIHNVSLFEKKIMKIGLQTWGSHGDIWPLLALAGGLSSAGHDVTVAYTSIDNEDYTSMAEALNFKIVKEYRGFGKEEEKVFAKIIKSRNIVKQFSLLSDHFFEPVVEDMYKTSEKLCSENDMVIGYSGNHTLLTASEKYNCPRAVVHTFPNAIESKHTPPVGAPHLGKLMNSLLWKLGDNIAKKRLFPSANKIRAREGLPLIKNFQKEVTISKMLTMIAASPSLCDRQPDWEDNIHICGFFDIPAIEEKWVMSEGLSVFINKGDPPIYFTFGSFTAYDVENTTELFIEAAKLSGRRAIIQSNWHNHSKTLDNPEIYRIVRAPYHRIFPYCSVIVHHGGAGTTQSSLRFGCPSVVVEHACDQTYWGQQLRRVGVAERTLHRRSVTARKLAHHIQEVLNSPSMKENAQKIGEAMKKENGVKTAVELIQNWGQATGNV
jgi:sterol 3beta-glucosyltransferase